jgi:spectinomycin phosphotransferase
VQEKPDLQDNRIIAHLWEAYGLQISRVEFLPIGDISTAKYRIITKQPAAYFLKLRKNLFEEISVVVPQFLHEQGIEQIIPPLKTKDSRLWTNLDGYTCILYPFIEGHNGFEDPLINDQWIELGDALKGIHSLTPPPALLRGVPVETYSPHWREKMEEYLIQVEHNSYEDPVAAQMAAEMRAHRDEIRFAIERAEQLGGILRSQSPERVLCHSDLHAGNLLLEANGTLHIIDWDNPILAPKERDLMFIGGGIGGIWNSAREEGLFYQGYSVKDIHLTALTYYRYERIVEDIVEFSGQILATTEGGADRERSLHKFATPFLPNQVFDIACQTDRLLKARAAKV